MIIVRNAYTDENNDSIFIKCPIEIDEKHILLCFEADKQYKPYLTCERGDAFLVMLFYFAMREHHDIKLESPVSERLLYQLETYLIDALHKADPEFARIQIDCSVVPAYSQMGTEVGTGMSCGVDSFATLYAHSGEKAGAYRVTRLTFFDVGAFNYDDGADVNDGGQKLFERQLAHAQKCAKDVQLPLMVVRSNLARLFPADHKLVHSYRNCGTVLLFQKLFRTYCYSSAYQTSDFRCDPHVDAAFYELYSLQMLSTDNTTFYSYSPSCSRLNKVILIQDFPAAQRHLTVCTRKEQNCGTCAKCARTLQELDAAGALEKFSAVFDLEKYKKTRAMQIGYSLSNQKVFFNKEICFTLRKRRKIPLLSNLYAFGFFILRPFERFLKSLPPEKKRKVVAFAQKYRLNVPW